MHKQKFHKEIPCDFIHFARDLFISYSQLPPIFHSADKARAVHPYLLAHGSLFYNADTLYIDKISFPAGVAADSAYETDDAPTFPENADFLVSVSLYFWKESERTHPSKELCQPKESSSCTLQLPTQAPAQQVPQMSIPDRQDRFYLLRML